MITSYFKTKSAKKRERLSVEAVSVESGRSKPHRECKDDGDETVTPAKKSKSSAGTVQVGTCEAEVQELVNCLIDAQTISADNQNGEITWRQALDKHISSQSFIRLAKFVATERKASKHEIYPPHQDTFSALNLTPLSSVKVVIVGQDPYHGPNQAHGLCFSVKRGIAPPPSLKNIYRELVNDPLVKEVTTMPKHGFLERWAKQGVLMINTVLTVRKGEANSHKNRGWESFTDEIIRAVDRTSRDHNTGVVFLLWGKPATKKATTILQSSGRHQVICTSHPSPLGATKTDSPFMGSRCFSRANKALENLGRTPIDWAVDGES